MKFRIFNKKRDLLSVSILVVFYLVFGVLLYASQERIIYQPGPQDFVSCAGFSSAEKIEHEGTRMYVKDHGSRAVVLYHGNAGSACDRAFMANLFEEAGYSYIVPEYTGYSNDIGKASHEALFSDVEHVHRYLQEKSYEEVVVVGESIGTGPASFHASISQADALLLISPYTTLADVAAERFWFYPTRLLVKDSFENTALLRDYRGRVLIVHGSEDDIIPMAIGRKLFESIGATDKDFSEIQMAGHNDLFDFPETYSAVSSFLRSQGDGSIGSRSR